MGSVEQVDRVKESVRVFRSMLPGLNGFVRGMTGNPHLRIEISTTTNGGTDGRTIQYRPPLALGERRSHDRALCDRRDARGQQGCMACRVRERVMATVYHEIAHNAYNSFEAVTVEDAADLTKRATEVVGSKYAKAIGDRLKSMPKRQKASYATLAALISSFLPMLFNSLEDARVNARMFDARKGTRAIFEAQAVEVFTSGVELPDGSRELWNTRPLNSQLIIGLFVKASGYDYKGWFDPKVEQALSDSKLAGICQRTAEAHGPGEVYHLAFQALARARELGYCKSERDPDVEEEDEQPDVPDPEQGEAEEDSDPGDGDAPADRGDGEDRDAGDESTDSDGEQPEPEDASPSDEPDSGEAPSDGTAPDEADDGSEGDAGDEDNSEGAASDDSCDAGSSDGAPDDGDSESDGDSGSSDDGGGSSEDAGGVGDEESPEGRGQDGSGSGDEASPDEQQEDLTDGEEGAGGGDSDPEGEPSSDSVEDNGGMGTGSGSGSSAVADGGTGLDGQDSSDAVEGDTDQGDGVGDDSTEGAADDSESGAEEGGSHSDLSSWDDEDAGEVHDGEEDADEASPGRDGYSQGDDGGGESAVEPDESEEEPADYGSSRDVERDVEYGLHHDHNGEVTEHTHDGEDSKEPSIREVMDLNREILQGPFFDTRSVNVGGVYEHTRTKPADRPVPGIAVAWERDGHRPDEFNARLGIAGDFDPSETILGPALLRMRVVFSNNKRAHDTFGLKAGKVNARALGKRAWGDDERLFKRKTRPGKRDYSVVIGMDVSGSTVGANLILEKRAVMAQAELLNRVGVRFAVVAHSGNYSGDSMTPGIYMDMYRVKDFDQPWTDTERTNLRDLGPDGGNLDGHTMEYYRKMLDRETTTDRIIMYYTDGKMPASNYEEELEVLQRELQMCNKKRYTVMGVGIRTDSPTAHGLETVRVDEDSDIPRVVTFLEKRLERTVR